MKYTPTHGVMERVLILTATYYILALSFYFFFAGHNNPGGGFIGGLTVACALALIYFVFDRGFLEKVFRITYPSLIGSGVLLSFVVGLIGVLFGEPFLTQYFDYVAIPLYGEVEITTALFFDLGVYLVVVGAAMVIMTTIAEDDGQEWNT